MKICRRFRTPLAVLVITAAVAGLFFLFGGEKVIAPRSEKPKTNDNTPAAATFNKQLYSLEDPSSIWIVVNKKRPLSPTNYVPPDLVGLGNGTSLRSEAANAFNTMSADAKKAEYIILPQSAYRSYSTQQAVYANEVKNYGQQTADTQSARPGHSEHQTGWALDLATPGCIEDCFGKTQAAVWVKQNAYKYGFIERYLAGKDNITGYRHEPWHYRYVGVDLASQLHASNQTLEEFFNLPSAKYY